MEYVDGPPLDAVMAQGPLPWPRLLQILREIAAGLDFAHSKGIIHRDIKPANILVSSAGHAKVSDFGVAKILEAPTMTMTGAAIGTPAYMSPEQILTKPLTGRSDQFSLAVIAFELLTGRRPFAADSLPGLIHQILSVDPPSATQINAEIREPAAGVLRRALAKDPTARFDSCTQFIADLDAALNNRPTTATIVADVNQQPSETKQLSEPPAKSGNMARAILFLALGLAVAGYFLSRQHPAEVATSTPASSPTPAAPVSVQPPPQAPVSPEPSKALPKATPNETTKEKKKVPAPEPVAQLPVPPPAAPQPQDPGPDQPATSYMGSPEGRFTWSGTLPAGERLVIVRNRVRMGSISGNGLPAGVPVQVEARPADIRVMQQPAAANGFRLILSNQSAREVSSFTVLWREQAH